MQAENDWTLCRLLNHKDDGGVINREKVSKNRFLKTHRQHAYEGAALVEGGLL